MKQFSKYVGLDVHKETIVVTVAEEGRSKSRFYGEIANTAKAVEKMVAALSAEGEVISFCYEAGPCGYGLYRQITDLGHECVVVAPSLIPRKPGDRVKTDRRDSDGLSRLHRAGELTSVWVPDQTQEALRDLVRCRADLVQMQKTAKQILNAFVLRQGFHYPSEKSKWTQAYWRWLEKKRLTHPTQQVVMQEYLDPVRRLEERIKAIEQQMSASLEHWDLAPLVQALMAMRGIRLVTAMGVVAELGDLSRFDKPTQLMAYLGVVPSEDSSGQSQKRGGITKAGNSHVRKLLVESAWSYQFQARKSGQIQRRAEQCSPAVQDIAWKAQCRLCARYKRLQRRGMLRVKIVTAIARELCGFIWAIAREVINPQRLAS